MCQRAFIVLLLVICLSVICLPQQALADRRAANRNFVIPLPVNINTADEQTLDRVMDGIGLVKARAIVEYRTANGPFQSLEDLTKVKGIGPGTLSRNEGRITVGE